MDERAPKDIFLESVQRCLADKTFIPSFYDRFLSHSDEISDKFKNTNFEKQNKMLARSLELCAGATSGDPAALAEIRERGVTHDRHNLDIKPELYDHWLEAIIETASKKDAQWSTEVEKAWHRILGHVVNHMVREY